MISGSADREATTEWAATHTFIDYRPLRPGGPLVSPAGFGCYRVSSEVESHRRALRQALLAGVNLIDTSANYADGKSEELVGQMLEALVKEGRLRRQAVVVVSKVGYLQGRNLQISKQREEQGRGFPERVPYAEGLEHCIHPEFLKDQLDRSLARLRLDCLDAYLLHNPEYYLGWAHKQRVDLQTARQEFHRRLEAAFRYLEHEVDRGRIQCYGVSSNTFPSAETDPQFTSLDTIWQIARSISPRHRFRVIQFPMNLLETGAVLERNQSGSRSLLTMAREKQLGVLINRPLNAIAGQRLLRLADAPSVEPLTAAQVDDRIRMLLNAEKMLNAEILTQIDVAADLQERLYRQLAVGDYLIENWREFGDLQRWLQVKQHHFIPRVAGGLEFLQQQPKAEVFQRRIREHQQTLEAVFQAIESVYTAEHARNIAAIRKAVARADADWNQPIPASRLALRALRSTAGVTAVLVGMRQKSYVDDVLAEIREPAAVRDRTESWRSLSNEVSS